MYRVWRLGAGDVAEARAANAMFGDAFDEREHYSERPPDDRYLETQLASDANVFLVAHDETGTVVGGLIAYELAKFEMARSEMYLYDLAVAGPHRRRGVATMLIDALRDLARKRRIDVIFVQADPPDAPAIALYQSRGSRESVFHFDLEV